MNNFYYKLLFVLLVFISSISQILLKKSARKLYPNKIREYINYYVLIGYTLFLFAIIGTTYAYQYITLKTGIILDTLGIVFVLILSYVFFKEKINGRQIKGVLMIILGIIISVL